MAQVRRTAVKNKRVHNENCGCEGGQDMKRLAWIVAVGTAVVFLLSSGTVGDALAQSAININWTGPCPTANDAKAPCQTIDGFGVSQTAGDPDYAPDPEGLAKVLHGWPEPQRSQIVDLAFSPTNGIGLTILRSKIRPNMEPSPGVWNNNDPYQRWLMQEAVARGPVKLIGSVWSPPGWMKSNGRTSSGTCRIGGANCRVNPDCGCLADPADEEHCGDLVCDGSPEPRLLPQHYSDFANYLSHYATAYAATNGVNIYAVSMANEPDSTQTWDSCNWSSSQIASFLSTPAAANIPVKVIAPESLYWSGAEPLMGATYSNAAARARLDIQAAHLYGGDPTTHFKNAKTHQKRSWVTEASGIHDVWTLDGALDWAKSIHDSMTLGRTNAWIWWNLALWTDNGSLIGLQIINGVHSFVISKTFWVLGHFSKFIRPGFVRMNVGPHSSGLDISAFRDPITDQFVIVAINRNTTPRTVSLNMQGFWTNEVTPYLTSSGFGQNLVPQAKTYLQVVQTVPAKSIVTYVSRTRNFGIWASAPGAKAVAGDFNGDGRADIALVGGEGWTTIPVAFSQGDGTFSVSNAGRWDFAGWASVPGVQVVAGDVNGDGRADLIATGGSGWWTIPVAYSNGDGTFEVSNLANWPMPEWAQAEGVKALAGDVDGDGRADLILTGGAGWWTIPVGFSNGDGTFRVTNHALDEFPLWAQDPYAQASAADLNRDGRTDIVLAGGADWTTVPMAFSRGDGSFWRENRIEPNMSIWSQGIGAKLLTGDVNGDLRGDVVLTGGADWITIPVGFSNGNGTLSVSNAVVSEFPTWAQDPSAKAVAGDFNGDGRADLALVGGNNWWTVPVAFSNGAGTFTVTNVPVP